MKMLWHPGSRILTHAPAHIRTSAHIRANAVSFFDDDDEGDDDANSGPADGEVPFLPAQVEVGDFRDPHGGVHVDWTRGTGEKSRTPAVLSECHDEKGNVGDEKAVHDDGEYERKGDGESESCKDRQRTPEKVEELCTQAVPRVGGEAYGRNLYSGTLLEERSGLVRG